MTRDLPDTFCRINLKWKLSNDLQDVADRIILNEYNEAFFVYLIQRARKKLQKYVNLKSADWPNLRMIFHESKLFTSFIRW